MNLFKNKGMYIEELINNSASFYEQNNICYIEKRFLPIIPLSVEGSLVKGKLIKKSSVDYCCLYQGYYIDMEVKQTDDASFEWSIIKKHQFYHLKRISNMNGIGLLLVYFFKYDQVYIFSYQEIEDLMNKGFKKITCNQPEIESNKVDIIFPGIIDFKSTFIKYINKN